ncbi:UNVERIFIED_CONTAM: Transposon TX1 uncharacterized protein [Sesamum calycinum]|uniref:Transposon TX1 uncharacterized protein n=1 Tax=Sesamum calycinum TaxID=2727403 RepID=A0AAW2JGF8_9LAMI
MEKLKAEFNIKEFIELASRVIDDGDSETMELLKKLENKWMKKLGGELNLGNGRFRPVHTRTPTRSPFRHHVRPGASFEVKRLNKPPLQCGADLGAEVNSEAPFSFDLEPPASAATHINSDINSAAPTYISAAPSPRAPCDVEPPVMVAPRASERPFAAAAAFSLASLTRPTPMPAIAVDGSTAPLTQPSPTRESSPRENGCTSSPPFFAVSSVPISVDSMLVGPSHHQSPAVTSVVQPSMAHAHLPSRDWVGMHQQHAAQAPLRKPQLRPQPPAVALPAATVAPTMPLPELFIGNVPLHPHFASKIDEDKIAAAFHNSSRKTLNFIPPSMQNGEVIVRPSIDMIRAGSHRWNTTAVGYFLEVRFGSNFDTCRELWTTEGLSTSGKWNWPTALPDAITCMHEGFRSCCVMLNVNSKLPKHVVIMMPNELGGESACKVSEEIHHQPEIDRVGDERPEHGRDKGGTIKLQSEILQTNSGYILSLYWKLGFCKIMSHVSSQAYYRDGDGLLIMRDRTVLLTVVYGANELSARRELWQGLIDLAITVGNEPWLTGLLPLPMQGERFTWHNCSLDGRSLWKRLDRLLVNDIWMERWPNLYYTCLTPRTSDHSPLVLKGDCRNMQVSLFRFDNYLALSPGFLASVHSIWRHPIVGTPILVYLKASKLEQIMLRQRAKLQWLKGGDQCSRIFFRRVATRRANKRVFQISDDDGNEQQNPTLLTVSLWSFSLLGDRTDRAIDLRYLRPWARHILTEDEARAIIRPVTTEEVKIAFFDIEEDKAPGPDGFSSGFKAAWPVVGEEVSSAIIDFFKTGRLLKQLNATLLTLIPKILVSRIRESLDLLISPSQNAFVPGRLISDNVLLAQELFSGYNQCRLPPRCALKVDLRKAYDTVEWDFLIATLQMFGFPATFIRWIEECVTSAHYSVVVNGGVHGFFAGARGLRQGDPMSPYLFVLVMEADVRSVNLFSRGLDLFASLSGLHTNPQKSQLIISKAASGLRDSLLATLGFQEGLLPLRYLGLPLISARLSITDCQPLLQKIDSRIKGWEGVQISFAGRVQLIKSVLISFEVYWAMAFILPKGIIKEMIKRLRTFLWKGTSAYGYPKVAWEAVCRPIDEGGLGIKDILALNRALMSKHLWAVIKQDRTSIWVDWIIQVRLRDCSIWTAKENKGAWGWRKMLSLRNSLMSHIHYRVGSGESVSLWHDPWHPLGPLISRFPRGPQMTRIGPLDKLSAVIKDGQWNWPFITDIACLEITHMLPPFWRARTESFGSQRMDPSTPQLLMISSTTRPQGALVLSFDGFL